MRIMNDPPAPTAEGDIRALGLGIGLYSGSG